MSKDFSAFWKDDFNCLQQTGKLLNEVFREDELQADLYHRIEKAATPYSHLYFPSSPSNLRHQRTIPIPPAIADSMRNGKNVQLGLAAHARRCWIIVDTGVYIWKFDQAEAYSYVQVPNRQYVVTAAVVHPKKGKKRGLEVDNDDTHDSRRCL